jgi:hypothetical protein
LNILAIVNRWSALVRKFDFLDRPAYRLLNAIHERIEGWPIDQGIRRFPTANVFYSRLTYVAYWMIICVLLAAVLCAIQILKKRKSAAAKRVSAECISGEQNSAFHSHENPH